MLHTEITDNCVPNTVIEYSVFDAHEAWSNCVNKFKRTGTASTLKYKTESSNQSIAVDGRSFKCGFIYVRNTTNMVKKLTGLPVSKEHQIKLTEKLPDKCNGILRIVYKKSSGKWYIIISNTQNKVKFENRQPVVSIDPGMRTFGTYYDINSFGKFGVNDVKRIFNLYRHHDRLLEKVKNIPHGKRGYHARRRMYKAALKVNTRIKNLVTELHWKFIDYLTKTYDTILLPKFGTQKMVGTLPPLVSRAMNSLSHFLFRQRLIHKCSERDCTLVLVNEAYTSKTCGQCGHIDNTLGSAHIYKCSECGLHLDRDFNGARNIMLRALRDASI